MAPTDTFTITAGPGTDIWRKPPNTDIFNAPTALPPTPSAQTQRTSGPLTSFRSARLSLNFTPRLQYDQGGLLLSLRRRADSANPTNPSPAPPAKWIKTGVEFYNNSPRLSTVACDRWADWSVSDLPSTTTPTTTSTSTPGQEEEKGEIGWTTVLVEKDRDGNGTGLWVYRVVEETGEKVPLREICWVFGQEENEEWEVEVRVMAARPAKEEEGGGEGLVVEFGGLEVQWAS